MRPRRLPGYAWLPSHNHSERSGLEPKLLVVHYTASLRDEGALAWLRSQGSNVSAHFLIARDGKVAQLVDLDRAAWHCGRSEYGGQRDCNQRSIGVELCNAGLLERGEHGFYVNVGGQDVRYTGPAPVEATLTLPNGEQVHGWWEPYTPEQLRALAVLAEDLRAAGYVLDVVGHNDIARPVGRKIDPGPLMDLEPLRQLARGVIA